MTSKFPFVFPGEAPQVSDQAMTRGEVGGLLPNVNEVHVCVELNLSFSEWTLMVCVLCMYVCGSYARRSGHLGSEEAHRLGPVFTLTEQRKLAWIWHGVILTRLLMLSQNNLHA